MFNISVWLYGNFPDDFYRLNFHVLVFFNEKYADNNYNLKNMLVFLPDFYYSFCHAILSMHSNLSKKKRFCGKIFINSKSILTIFLNHHHELLISTRDIISLMYFKENSINVKIKPKDKLLSRNFHTKHNRQSLRFK